VTAYPASTVRLDGALFYSRYTDLIAPGAAPGQFFVFQFQNINRARVLGTDIGIHAAVRQNLLDVEASYLFLETEDLSSGAALPYRSRHNLTGTVTLFNGLGAADLRYRSRVEEVLAYPADERGSMTTLDLRGAYRAFGLTFLATVRNLFNTFYTDVQERSPGAPRQFVVGVYSEF
jgi:outer membrane receptor protein involved in Fe transport